MGITAANPPRNEPCPCGSGRKFKKCCYLKEWQEQGEELERERQALAASRESPKGREESRRIMATVLGMTAATAPPPLQRVERVPRATRRDGRRGRGR